MAFCRNCGKELPFQAQACVSCLTRPGLGDAFCDRCGEAAPASVTTCPKCGAVVRRMKLVTPSRKSKAASVLLAIFLGFWTWLYTYKKDGWKFRLALGLALSNTFLLLINTSAWAMPFAMVVSVTIWVWSIVDTTGKSNDWYNYYS